MFVKFVIVNGMYFFFWGGGPIMQSEVENI